MLGKTNINTLTEGTIVTEIEDYRWIQMQSGVFGDFVKAIYQNGYLVAITVDGKVVYTVDGEVWNTYVFEYEDCELNDIEWDGRRFILAGSYKEIDISSDENATEKQVGLLVITSDFVSYEKREIVSERKDVSEQGNIKKYYAIYPKNDKYIAIVSFKGTVLYRCIGNLENKWEEKGALSSVYMYLSIAKNSNGIIVGGTSGSSQTYNTYYVNKIEGDTVEQNLIATLSSTRQKGKMVNVFECKDELYYISMLEEDKYKFVKVLSSSEEMLISNEINYMFVDSVYFNGCLLFINNHEMLIVKKGENIADKTMDDLIEIAPEFTMNCITKAFGQLYIFGNRGVILKSSVETNNEDAVTVQTLSAKKALSDAKKYTDKQFAELEARVAALESLNK